MSALLPATTGLDVTWGGQPRRNRVVCCDALTLLKALPSGSVDLVVTSPPYDALRQYKGYSFDFEAIAHESYRVLKDGGVMVWVVGDATVNGSETLTSFRQALYFKDVVGFCVETMIYQKNASSPNIYQPRYMQVFEYMFVLVKGSRPRVSNLLTRPNKLAGVARSAPRAKMQRNGTAKTYGKNAATMYGEECVMENVWVFNTGAATGDDLIAFSHPAPFPEALAKNHILSWTNPGDLVLDFFAGSGTTLKMARNTGRDFIGGDISYDYVQICRERLRTSAFEQHYVTRESAPLDELPLFAAGE